MQLTDVPKYANGIEDGDGGDGRYGEDHSTTNMKWTGPGQP